MHSVDRRDSGAANARRTLTPLVARVCTPRYYDTQQAGVYSTPSKNTLGARHRALLRSARRCPRTAAPFGSLSKNHEVSAPRATPLVARPCTVPPITRYQSGRRVGTALTYVRPGHDLANGRGPGRSSRSRPRRLAQGSRRVASKSRAARRDAEFFRGPNGRRILFADTKRNNEHED